MDTAEEILKLVDRYGVSVVLLALVIIATWKVIKWLAPRAERLVEAHVTMMEALGKSHDTLAKNQEVLTKNSNEHGQMLVMIEKRQIEQVHGFKCNYPGLCEHQRDAGPVVPPGPVTSVPGVGI